MASAARTASPRLRSRRTEERLRRDDRAAPERAEGLSALEQFENGYANAVAAKLGARRAR